MEMSISARRPTRGWRWSL